MTVSLSTEKPRLRIQQPGLIKEKTIDILSFRGGLPSDKWNIATSNTEIVEFVARQIEQFVTSLTSPIPSLDRFDNIHNISFRVIMMNSVLNMYNIFLHFTTAKVAYQSCVFCNDALCGDGSVH